MIADSAVVGLGKRHHFRVGIAASAVRLRAPSPWQTGAVLALLCGGAAVGALASPVQSMPSQQHQWNALTIQPLSAGGSTGLRLTPSEAVEPIDAAPDRPRIELTMTISGGADLGAMLVRAGASSPDAATTANLIRSAASSLESGTQVVIVLGARNGPVRPIERIALRANLGLGLEVIRSGGALQLVRKAVAVDTTPLRVRGRAGDGLYWSLRAAGVTPQAAAEYLQALATEIDVGSEVAPDDRFDLVIASRFAGGQRTTGPLLYAGFDRSGGRDLQLLKWPSAGRVGWVDAADFGKPTESAGMAWPVHGRITSGFGYRRHPILRFGRMHRGIDFGAGWGSPIVAAADGQVVRAGWAGGYGRQVRIAHGGGIGTSYSHMSSIAASPGSFVRRGQLIGYVGSSGLSTGPHLHYEVYRSGVAVNPLSVRFAGPSVEVDPAQVAAFKARLKALLSVGVRRG